MPRLLIVDDNESIHDDFKKVLTPNAPDKLRNVELALFGEDDPDLVQEEQPLQYDIDDAFQGQDAIDMVAAAAATGNPYAVVFMDVRMPPGIDGVKAASEIWRRFPETEIVICSAHSDYSWSDMLNEIGVSDKLQFIRKPFDMVTVQQLALSCSKKWELEQTTKDYIRRLEIENRMKEEAQAKLAKLNDELEERIEIRTRELQDTNKNLQETMNYLKDAQEQLVASEKMAALGGLVAGVAHEINTPVGVAVTAASHLHQKTENISGLFKQAQMKKSDLVRYLEVCDEASLMILSNLNRAAELIQSFKKVAVDQSCEETRRFEIKSYIQEVLLSMRPKLKKTKLAVEVDGPELEINNFPGAFAQVISNFLMNSIIHAYEPGQTGTLRFKIEKKEDALALTYSDDGKGIPEEHLKKVFDPFFTTKRGNGGSGLGMHIVYNIVTQTMKGKLSCESEVNKGTTFTVEVPLNISEGGEHG